MKKLILAIFILANAIGTNAQSRKELVELGDNAYKQGNYASAIYFFNKLFSNKPGRYDMNYPYEVKAYSGRAPKKNDKGEIKTNNLDEKAVYAMHKLADSYRELRDYENAEKWYAQAVQNKQPQFPHAKYYYGLALMNNAKYDEATKVFEEFITEVPADDPIKATAEMQMAGCVFARNDENIKPDVKILELDSNFNKGTSAFGISYFTDNSIIFASARKGNNILDEKKEIDYFTTDFYITTDDSTGYGNPQHMMMPINSNMNEGAGALGVDRTTFYFTRWNPYDKTDCNIYVSRMFNRRWLEPLKIEGLNVEGYKTMHPSLTLDESRLYFVSDRPGGLGGLDIWYCPLDADGNLGTPVNMGAPINTVGDETSPFFHFQSSTLFFSSNGHSGYGGLDVYKSHYSDDDEAWSMPVNIGAPINSSKDDEHYIMDKDQVSGYFTSDREKCTNCDTTQDIQGHCYRVYKFTKSVIKITLSGYVYNAETDEVIPNALITIKDVTGVNDPDFIQTDDKGYYFKEMTADQEWFMKAQKVKFFADAATVKTIGITESTDLTQDFFLRPIPGDEIEIPGIEYDFNSANLRPKSKEILDKLYDFLTLNDNLTVEIKSHTDCRGSDKYNQKLSQERAQSCVDYLISKGIKKDRIIPQGKGESEPVPGHKCDEISKFEKTDPEKFEAMHQKNRRTAFKVVKEGDTNPVLQGGQ